jgi:hypothetical protein
MAYYQSLSGMLTQRGPMPEILDTGKVWLRGRPGTSFAIKVDDKVFIPGLEESQTLDYWVDTDSLCVDIHDPAHKIRVARRFPLDLPPLHPATLFNGFNKTKHADVKVIGHEDPGVMQRVFEGTGYESAGIAEMPPKDFWVLAGL